MSDKSQTTGPCPVCDTTTKLKKYENIEICADCSQLASTVVSGQERIARLNALLAQPAREHVEDLPDVLDARRYRTRDRENNSWYVSISEMEGEPVEIFASTAFDRDQHLQSRISNLTTITRLISLILRHISLGEQLTLEKTLVQLQRSSRQRNDLPDMLAKVLANYSKKQDEVKTASVETP